MPSSALVLHSGGLDSTVCLLLAKEQADVVYSLGIDYGQRHRVEMEYAAAQCRRLGIQRHVIKVEWTKPTRDMPLDRNLESIRASGVSSAFLPARNSVFLTLGFAEAAGLHVESVWIGVNAVDYSGYPDCRPDFIASFRTMMGKAMPNAPALMTPLITLSKPEIASEAQRLGLKRGDTWSCYRPAIDKDGLHPCGRCDACVLEDYAWNQAPSSPASPPKAST